MPPRHYTGVRVNPGPGNPGRLFVLVDQVDGGVLTVASLPPRLELRNHSPAGFECGYGGSGPAQLALAILADHYGPHGVAHALALYQAYKAAVVAALPREGTWVLSSADVAAWLRARGEDATN